MRRYAVPIGCALGMLMLILDGRTAMIGAAEGIALCARTLIPNLFPFFFLSALLTSALPGGLLLTGILGGYPVGAGNVAAAFRAGRLRRSDAERMIVLCNCAGPSFIFGVIVPVLGDLYAGFQIWGSYLFSIFLMWIILPKAETASGVSSPMDPQRALWISIRAMAGVCGWVILFKVFLTILDRWILWLLPEEMKVILYGILELSNGCLALGNMDSDLAVILAAGFVAFGGICVFLQTRSVTEEISMKYYYPGKVFQSAVSMLAVSILRPGTISVTTQIGLFLTASLLGLGFRKSEKRYGNPQRIIV